MYAHSRAPVRVGIAGGGTDLPAWTKSGRAGECLSLAIAAYTHAVAISRSDGQVVAAYRQRDVGPSATEIANGLIRESALLHDWEDGFEVHTLSELSSHGSGLGVSSSIAVALAACFRRMAMARAGDARMGGADDPQRAAQDAWMVEIDRLRRPIGRQDHMAAAHGGLRLYGFVGAGAEVRRSFTLEDAEWVAEHLRLVELPEGHDSRALLARATRAEDLQGAFDAVPLAIEAIEKRSAAKLGLALDAGQRTKTALPGATPPWLEELLRTISNCRGVRGCKVAGAGGGGHAIAAVDGGDAASAIAATTKLKVFKVVPDCHGVRSEAWT